MFDRSLTASILFTFICAEIQGILRKSIPIPQVHHPQIRYDSAINKVIFTQRGYIQVIFLNNFSLNFKLFFLYFCFYEENSSGFSVSVPQILR